MTGSFAGSSGPEPCAVRTAGDARGSGSPAGRAGAASPAPASGPSAAPGPSSSGAPASHAGNPSAAFNLGNGQGFSNREIIEAARKVTGHPIPVTEEGRRPGDPATLIASSQKAMDVLGWKPRHPDVEDVIASAWKWHAAHPNGYGED